jgi:predicted glycosyltransferase involved in capsule biosynthesis
MKLGIVIPWRPQPTRIAAFHRTVEEISDAFPDASIYFCDTESERFNRSASRNRGCRFAIKDGCDVLLVLDADVILEKEAVENSIRVASELGIVSLPSLRWSRLDEKLSTSLLNKELSVDEIRKSGVGNPNQSEVGGCWVMSSSTFLKLNGWDERFVGWGFEDDAFREAHKVLLDRDFHRSAGHGVTFYHLDRDQEGIEDNRQRFYGYTNKSKEEMLELISGNILEGADE